MRMEDVAASVSALDQCEILVQTENKVYHWEESQPNWGKSLSLCLSRITRIQKTAIQQMLEHYGLDLGLAHSGLEDAVSIAKITIEMMRRDNCELRVRAVNREYVKFSDQWGAETECDQIRTRPGRSLVRHASSEAGLGKLTMTECSIDNCYFQVRKEEFFSGEYLDCDSCDEDDDWSLSWWTVYPYYVP